MNKTHENLHDTRRVQGPDVGENEAEVIADTEEFNGSLVAWKRPPLEIPSFGHDHLWSGVPAQTLIDQAFGVLRMRWTDRVYGDVEIDDPDILNLIATPTFARLRGIRQAGPSTLAFPFKTVTRHEHSLGVYLLLRRLGADRREQVAGLLHDISHTAFSHAVDFVVASQEQDHHEGLKPVFLSRPDIASALKRFGHIPENFFDDSIYPLLERPLPWLCADRLDYFFRDGLTCEVVTPNEVNVWLNALVVHDHTIAFNNVVVARDAADKFATMNRNWWASPTESFIYNEFADVLREGFNLGSLRESDLLGDDAHVLSCLKSARSERIEQSLKKIYKFQPESLESFTPKVTPKERWLDPPILIDGTLRRLSEIKL